MLGLQLWAWTETFLGTIITQLAIAWMYSHDLHLAISKLPFTATCGSAMQAEDRLDLGEVELPDASVGPGDETSRLDAVARR